MFALLHSVPSEVDDFFKKNFLLSFNYSLMTFLYVYGHMNFLFREVISFVLCCLPPLNCLQNSSYILDPALLLAVHTANRLSHSVLTLGVVFLGKQTTLNLM